MHVVAGELIEAGLLRKASGDWYVEATVAGRHLGEQPRVRPRPCRYCPYRCDAPSGLWSEEEYAKLRAYDKPTGEQPALGFACHSTPESHCHGWAVTHSSRGGAHELLALRLRPAIVPPPAVALFPSGSAAAAHGCRDLGAPGATAKRAARELLRRHGSRLARRDEP